MLNYDRSLSKAHCNMGIRALFLTRDIITGKVEKGVLDERLERAVFLLNLIDGVATTWSCQGHHVEEDEDRLDHLYISMVATDEGKQVIRNLYRHIFHRLREAFQVEMDNEAEFDNDAWFLTYREDYLFDSDSGEWYETVFLETHTPFETPKHYEIAARVMTDVIEDRVGYLANYPNREQAVKAEIANYLKHREVKTLENVG